MSWSSHRRAVAALILAATLATGLGACSFSPVYSGALAARPTLDIAYAQPTTRLEQIIYQELALRLGSSSSQTSTVASVSASASGSGSALMTSVRRANAPAQVTVTARLTLKQPSEDAPAVTIIRRATADYSSADQVLADNTAASEAEERAARAVAESLRLALLAALSRR